MTIHEIGLWSAMAGGLVTLAVLTLSDALSDKWEIGALRNAVFVLAAGAAVVIVTGLPEVLFPQLSGVVMRMLKASIGPLVAALTLYYLGQWMGGAREDAFTSRIMAWGAGALVLIATCLAIATIATPKEQFASILIVTAAVTLLAALLGGTLAMRASALGDPLAHWMAVSCGVLFFMSLGIYLKGLDLPLGWFAWALTAALNMAFFILTSVLVRVRNLENRRLGQITQQDPSVDPNTGLPSGAGLVSKIEHSFWVIGRKNGRCTVMCIYLKNLYELADSVGHGADFQILRVMAARIRRVVGFRCLVGLYHPRCFVVVMDANQHRARLPEMIAGLREFLPHSIHIQDGDGGEQVFHPIVGLGLTESPATEVNVLDVLHDTEQKSQNSIPSKRTENDVVTVQ